MPSFEHGIRRAIAEIMGGAITSVVVRVFVETFDMPSFVLAFKILNLISMLLMIYVMPYWGTSYMLGWILGVLALSRTGFLSAIELLVYVGFGMFVLIARLSRK